MIYHIYVTLAGENKISILTMDAETGELAFQEDVALGGSPGPLATDPQHRFLYVGVRSTQEISSFRIERGSGKLALVSNIPLDADPCFLHTDRTGRFLLSAYYSDGRVGVHAITPEGGVEKTPIEWLSTAKGAHALQTDPSNQFAFAPHVLESNAILQFIFDENAGTLSPNPETPKVTPPPGTGPRHFCFHPTKDIVYFDNEQGCSVTAYHLDPSSGTLQAFQTISTLPEGFDEENTCAQIHIAASGRALYASNRGHDSIACFAIDPHTGRLSSMGQEATEEMPRAFNLTPHDEFLLVSSLVSDNLTCYQVDKETGALSPIGTYPIGKRPMWILPLDLTP
ncbi:MAG: lactonase family protein [Chloroflexota bacterium]|nr:lactonase family protein [Chloroflexota bacterium]